MFCRYPPGSSGPISAGHHAFSAVYITNTCLPYRFFAVWTVLLPGGELTPGSLIDQPYWTQNAESSFNAIPKASSASLSFSYALCWAALYLSEAFVLDKMWHKPVLHRWEWIHVELLLRWPCGSVYFYWFFKSFVNACHVFWSSLPPFPPQHLPDLSSILLNFMFPIFFWWGGEGLFWFIVQGYRVCEGNHGSRN